MAVNFSNFKFIEKAINLGLKLRRELRASRNEKRAERREERAEENFRARNTKTYFGRQVEVKTNSTEGDV